MNKTNIRILRSLKKIALVFILMIGLIFISGINSTQAQSTALQEGLNVAADQADYNKDLEPYGFMGNIISALIGMVGVVFVCMLIYGGFRYMTAGGNEQTVGKAKQMMSNSVIGLIIVISAYAVTEFVLNSLASAM